MHKRIMETLVIVLGMALLLGIGGPALADWSQGHPRGGGWHQGGDHPYCMYHKGDYRELTKEQIKSLEEERKAFMAATEDLRQQLHEKRAALRAELAKASPSKEDALKIQATISKLQGELAQKRIEHELAVKKIDPHADWGFPGKKGRHFRRGVCRQ